MVLPNRIKKIIFGCMGLMTFSLAGMEQPKHPAFGPGIYETRAHTLLDTISTLAKKYNKPVDDLNNKLRHFLTKHVINNNNIDEKLHLFIDNITLKDIQNINMSTPRKDVELLFWWHVQKLVLFGVLKNVGCSYQDLHIPGVKLEKVSQEVFTKKVRSFYQPLSKDYATKGEAQALAVSVVSLIKECDSRAEITDFPINESDITL